uniref:Uncharacterized protein n=1 Tax=Romanomermis culicivorax TaxID=13658 RepID=A0A915K2D6_ROMCU
MMPSYLPHLSDDDSDIGDTPRSDTGNTSIDVEVNDGTILGSNLRWFKGEIYKEIEKLISFSSDVLCRSLQEAADETMPVSLFQASIWPIQQTKGPEAPG